MSRTTITRSNGNVFADLGMPDAKEHAVKAALVARIAQSIASDGLSQVEAAGRMGLTQPDVSRLLKGQFRPFSIERLMRLLTQLGQDVTIEVRTAKRGRTGKLTVAEA